MEKIFETRFILTAGEADARCEMPPWLIASRIIEVATMHANALGIGYAVLSKKGVAWVLSRLAFEMFDVPRINAVYGIRTWIESWNRIYSERCFEFIDVEGKPIGFARTIWVTINIATRRPADLTQFAQTDDLIYSGKDCPVTLHRRVPQFEPNRRQELVFGYSDTDFNGHVNSVRYITHILDAWSSPYHREHRVRRFEISYNRECRAGQTACLLINDTDPCAALVDINTETSERAVTAIVGFEKDKF